MHAHAESSAVFNSRARWLLLLAGILVGILIVGLVAREQLPLLVVGILAVMIGILILKMHEAAIYIFSFVFYTNLAVVAHKFHGVPGIVVAIVPAMLVVPLIYCLLHRREKVILHKNLSFLLIYLAALILSSLLVRDVTIALQFIINFLAEGFLLYFLVTNAIRTLPILKRVIWILLLACSVMAGVTLLQELTHSYENSYGGFAQRNVEMDLEGVDFNAYSAVRRAQGPIGEKNRYAQVLVVILPLALCLIYVERSRAAKLLAAVGAAFILAGIILTFSRGTFVILVLLVFPIMYWRYLKPWQVLSTAFILALFLGLAMPEYFARMSGLASLNKVFSSGSEVREADSSFRGRLAENLAALNVFLDYPALGVGPGHFPRFYVREYGNKVGTKLLVGDRRAHNLYLEMGAETGVVGLAAFMAIVIAHLYQLLRWRQRFLVIRPDLANIATAFMLGILAYLGTAIFLHLSYQRYYWFLLALAGAAVEIFRVEASKDEPEMLASIESEENIRAPSVPHIDALTRDG